ncbi:hypothetical protein OOZ19_07935 [Saccharopolyspora sp. NFXS83]|uniref:hypothetical protein n=1 Tax=Saccharopolyspora sp. NFXS83 TaxID=2993560 RepID=UPI00224B3E43|nr:hypothetical protein [Saccharopolyspora sp. NFXS83]MCX2730168.1 hypothetical protein [Saccharopolyspora sp. NFXS83]
MGGSISGDGPTRNAVILIAHGIPAYRYGLALGLEKSEFAVQESAPADASNTGEWDACLVEVSRSDASTLATLRATRRARVLVALLDEPDPEDYRAALRLGADGLVAQDAALDEIITVLRLALRGSVLLPLDVARSLSAGTTRPPTALNLTGVDRELLTRLAMGSPVADIAKSAGYSERQMYRLVREIYHRLGSRNRSEAIATATRWGLISGDEGATAAGADAAGRPPPRARCR